MLPKMRYRLGLDIGSTSIGWCLVRLNADDDPVAIIRMGVRIFSDGRNPKDGSSLAVTRRTARQMRRRRDRLLKRKEQMLAALIRMGFFPQDEAQRKDLAKLDPYVLRKKGLDEPLTGPEFARALFHINQRRGFLSNRKTDKKDSESGTLKKAIKDLHEKLQQENCRTLGEWLAKRHEARLSVRARLRGKTQKDKAYDFYADRAMIEHEFDTLWANQSSINPELFNEAARDELKDVLLYQRNLKPVKPGRCTLLPDEERAPLALPSTQRFRIYQELNNLRLLTPDLREQPLMIEQRNTIAHLLERGDASFTKILRALKLSGATQFNLQDIKRDRLKGNATTATLSRDHLFGERWYGFDPALQDNIVDRLLNEASESALVEWLQQHTGVDEATAERIANAGLPEGYGNLSRAALARVLPELTNDVVVYSEAVTRAGFDSHSALSHAQQTGEIMESLPYYGIPLRRHVAFAKDNPRNDEERYGKIANPTVHIGLNELRKVVNALIKRYGHPSEVIVEVARELKLGRERKQEIQKEQKVRQDLNDKHVAEACTALGLTPSNLDKAKRRELSQKMQLWDELNKDAANRRCPYTGEQISITRLLSSEVEIEHILPYSMTLDDSLNNKTVSMRRANRDKGNRAPFDAFGAQLVPGYDYAAILERAALMPKVKAKRFAPDGYQQWLKDDKDFLARALNDTAYLSRIAKEYLSLICPPNQVRAIPGRMTALLRGKFGLNHLLSGSEGKNRNDHRHHALDAAVIAVTDQGLLQRFAKASASARERQLDRLVEEMPFPWPTYREHVERALNHIVVSHKPDHGFEGSIFKDTAFGLKSDGSVIQKKRAEGEKNRTVEYIVPIYEPTQTARHGTSPSGGPRPYKGYAPDGNYCLEIVETESGDWSMETIPVFKAYQLARDLGHGKIEQMQVLQKMIGTKLSGIPGRLIMKLMPGDVVRMTYKGVPNRLLSVVKMSVQGGATFTEPNESNVSGRYEARRKARLRLKAGCSPDELERDEQVALRDVFVLSQIGVAELRAGCARKVTISPIGDLRDPGFKG